MPTYFSGSVRSADHAEGVVKKEGLQLDGASLITTLKPIPKELPKDQKRFHVMGISDRTIRDGLVSFLEVVSGKEVESLLFGDNSNCVVSFTEPVDFPELQRICKTSSLDDCFFNIEQVKVCDTIEISGFTVNTTQDTILYYFRNKRNGGGDVERIDMIDEGRVLLSFEDHKERKKSSE
ncbi:uncharacterized protein LOC116299450 [Actinia tenebrosa]|uniref:Uncharacterized protein LOC116299450 n=1 Tax=Actinia tenebrosa TaxID=6105 RepID=A0A6P8I5W0_ACTTE|nr:uncharacterized protein LOC116299450 [Actinia tenebrosa]